MRVLHVSGAGVSGGGAARATYRLHTGLREADVDSRVLVGYDDTSDPTVDGTSGVRGRLGQAARRRINKLPLYRYPNRDSELFSPAWVPERRLAQIRAHDPDIVHLHWVAGGFLRPKTIAAIDVPVVWTLHDMWPFTGGCHYSKSCTRYTQACGNCPHLDSDQSRDLSRVTWKQKRAAWQETDLTVVSPSQWLAREAAQSSLFADSRIEVIHNGVDTDEFRPRPRSSGTKKFNLNDEMKYVLFGAAYSTRRKGGDLLRDALDCISDTPDISAITFGGTSLESSTVPISHTHLGWLSDNDLQLAYSTADVMVVPSRQEAFGQTASEALASGTPVVAFDTGGLRDIVDHKRTGYLAEALDPTALADGIKWVISNTDQHLRQQARESAVHRFSLSKVANQYHELYDEIS